MINTSFTFLWEDKDSSISQVYVTGSFNEWNGKIPLKKVFKKNFLIKIKKSLFSNFFQKNICIYTLTNQNRNQTVMNGKLMLILTSIIFNLNI